MYVDGEDLNTTRVELRCSGDAAAKGEALKELEESLLTC